jgi:signal transduction histidine kinase
VTVDLAILLIVNIANFLLGVGVLLRNSRMLINRVFAFLSFSIVFWATMNYIADHSSAVLTPLFTRVTLLGGVLIVLSVITLSRVFPDGRVLRKTWYNTIQPWLGFVVGVLTLTPLVVETAVPGEVGAQLTDGPLYIIYVIYILQGLVLLIVNLLVQAKRAKVSYQKNQVAIVLSGILLYAFFAILSNVILPLFMNNWSSSRFGPIFSLVLVGSVAYAVAKHKLFDIRWALARSISYAGAFLLFAGLYGVLVFGIVNLIFQLQLPIFFQVIIAATTGISAIAFPSFRKAFDNLTSKFFYKYDFDSQEFFKTFSRSIAVSTDLNKVLHDASSTIIQFLKVEYCLIYVGHREDGVVYQSKHQQKFSKAVQDKFIIALDSAVKPIVVVDDLPHEQGALRQFFYAHQVAALVPLHAGGETQDIRAYIVLGPKQNGGSYNKKDIGVLESAANELSLALQNALRFEQIRDFNDTLKDRIEEATKELRATNSQLQRLDEAKDEFISMASHQLRTPLTSVKGYISMVLEGDAGKVAPTQKQLLDEAFASSERMVHLINDFLNVSRLQTGKFMLEQRPVDLTKIVRQEVESLQTTVKMHDLKLKFHPPKYFPTLYIDEGKIRQVIMNFIDNAIYYSRENSTITVSLSVVDGDAVLEVHDTGIGVPKDEQAHLFGKFFRATNARKQRPDGTGVGLFLAKKVIVAHGGSMVFHSVEGEGSTFGFRLPVKKLSTAPASESPNKLHK